MTSYEQYCKELQHFVKHQATPEVLKKVRAMVDTQNRKEDQWYVARRGVIARGSQASLQEFDMRVYNDMTVLAQRQLSELRAMNLGLFGNREIAVAEQRKFVELLGDLVA